MSTATQDLSTTPHFTEEWEQKVIEAGTRQGRNTEWHLIQAALTASQPSAETGKPNPSYDQSIGFIRWSQARHQELISQNAFSTGSAFMHSGVLHELECPEETAPDAKAAFEKEKLEAGETWVSSFKKMWEGPEASDRLNVMTGLETELQQLLKEDTLSSRFRAKTGKSLVHIENLKPTLEGQALKEKEISQQSLAAHTTVASSMPGNGQQQEAIEGEEMPPASGSVP